ncbi:MAG: hypothetical protein WD206_03845 [Actinomycetota bacterium]
MPNSTDDPSMREAECPYCERTVLVYQEPPRCPLCDCPLDDERTHPYEFPPPSPPAAPRGKDAD